MNGWYFVLGLIAWQILKMLWQATNRAIIERRQRRFLKLVNVTFPDSKAIAFIALDTSDKRSMQRLERQLREQYDPEPDIPDSPMTSQS
jgi:short-subunit dehydrogenase involved in D-alanine esterification of teichoic acids